MMGAIIGGPRGGVVGRGVSSSDRTKQAENEAKLKQIADAKVKAQARLDSLHAAVKDSMFNKNRTPEEESSLDEQIDHAVRVRKRIEYFNDLEKEISVNPEKATMRKIILNKED